MNLLLKQESSKLLRNPIFLLHLLPWRECNANVCIAESVHMVDIFVRLETKKIVSRKTTVYCRPAFRGNEYRTSFDLPEVILTAKTRTPSRRGLSAMRAFDVSWQSKTGKVPLWWLWSALRIEKNGYPFVHCCWWLPWCRYSCLTQSVGSSSSINSGDELREVKKTETSSCL